MKYYNFQKLREINLNFIVTTLFNAVEIDTRPSYNTRKYNIQPNHKIAITGSKWIDNMNSKGGFGALDLVMYINSCSLTDAACILEKMLNEVSCITTDDEVNKKKCIIPPPCESTWHFVEDYLIKKRRIPKKLLTDLYNNLLIWSDKNKNCVFPRDLNSGAYLRGTLPGNNFKMSIGINGRPYVIPGDYLIIITEAPIDAISLKYYYSKATIIATGGRIGFDKIEPYLNDAKKILLTHDNDKAGDEQANRISENIATNTERLRPLYNFKDWNEVLQYDNIYI
jgi:hypothetical protein